MRHINFPYIFILLVLLNSCILHTPKQSTTASEASTDSMIVAGDDSIKQEIRNRKKYQLIKDGVEKELKAANGDYNPALDAYYDSIKAEDEFKSKYKFIKDRINRKIIATNGNYYMMMIDTMRKMQLSWGNDTIKRTDTNHYELYVADRIHIVQSNNDYLIVDYGTGSDTHLSLVLPINKTEPLRTIENVFSFDPKNNLIVSEYWGGCMLPNKIPGKGNNPDTILVVTNLKTNLNRYIVERELHCGSIFWHYCIDSISLKNQILYYEWVIPDALPSHREDSPKKTRRVKRIKIDI